MKLFFAFIISVIFFSSCGLNDDNRKKDTPTSGKVNLFFDEGLTLHIIIKFLRLNQPILMQTFRCVLLTKENA